MNLAGHFENKYQRLEDVSTPMANMEISHVGNENSPRVFVHLLSQNCS